VRIVAALGGNALLKRGEKPDADVQERNVATAVAALAPLADEHELVVTHGNGPQVGVLALQSASDPHLTTPYPFDVLGAQTQGMIGYWLLQAMQNAHTRAAGRSDHQTKPWSPPTTRRSTTRRSSSGRSTPNRRPAPSRRNGAGPSSPTDSSGGASWAPRHRFASSRPG
jgi:hypothetical protein